MIPDRRISISITALLTLGAIAFGTILLWQMRSLLVVMMIAIVLASTLSPIVRQFERVVPRWLAVIFVYLGLIVVFTGLGLLIGPTVIAQIQRLAQKLPGYLDLLSVKAENWATAHGITEPTALDVLNQLFDLQALVSWTFQSSQQLLVRSIGVTRGLLGWVFNLLLAFLLSGYLLAGSNNLIQGIVSLFPKPWDDRLAAQVAPVGQRMGGYIQGRVLVSFILSLAISIGLRAIGISEFALGLGAIAGVTNLIPFFGPVLGSIPALIVALAQGGWTFFEVLLLFVIIQNLETYVLDPLLVGSSVKVPPLYQLLAVLGGVQVLGIIGALIVPPWLAGAGVVLENLYLNPKLAREQAPIAIHDDLAEHSAGDPVNPTRI